MASVFGPTSNTGGSFSCEAGSYAIGRTVLTTSAPDDEVSLRFTISRRPLVVRIGTTAGGQELVNDVALEPGVHLLTFTPGVGTYYFEAQLRDVGQAILSYFERAPAGTLSLLTPWAEADMPGLCSEQSLDVQWWTHQKYPPRVLERRGATSWSLRYYQPKDGPFEGDEDTGVTLTPSARIGTSVITSSGPTFNTLDTGSLIRLTQTGQYQITSANAPSEATDPIKVTGAGEGRTFYFDISGTFVGTWKLQRSVGNDFSWGDVTDGTGTLASGLGDGLDGQIVYYRLILSAHTSGAAVLSLTYAGGVTDGVARIVEVTADNEVIADVLTPFATTNATSEWARGSWSDRYGWPSAVALDEGRLSLFRGSRRWHSASDGFESFELGTDDSAAIAGSVPGQMNAVRWAMGGNRMTFGTTGGVGIVGTGDYDEVLTPSNSRARVKANRGSASTEATATATGEIVYVDRARRKINMAIEDGAGLKVVDLTRNHRKAAGTGQGFIELDFQTEPEPRLWAVRGDGQAVVMTLDTQEEVGAIARFTGANGGLIESVGVLPGSPEDVVMFVIRRSVNGSYVRYVEKLAVERWEPDVDANGIEHGTVAFRLQCGLVYSGASTTTITGLGHLEGQSVWAWSGGRADGPKTVTGGAITLSYPTTFAVVGLKYVGLYKGPRLSNAFTDRRKVSKVGMILDRCAAGHLGWGPSLNAIKDRLKDRTTEAAAYDSAVPLISRDQEFSFPGTHDNDPRLCIEFSGVGPASVLGLVVTTSGG